ncbi:ATP-dependent zinc protease [Marinobacter litoralis]|uniref:ATP-dependent zinc protease family protein n=1 Tax=Marinobacter litoralis TaxID=187981 RepID=UPI0018EC6E1D|nr:ATP-dependent zinc protease [Marinobacter litoralis]MBJ6136531.1 ATP-dependent zinc protease [Marinobacter litoralis]
MRSALMITALMSVFFITNIHAASPSDPSAKEPEVLGFVEWVVMDDTEVRLKGRLDTGAKTSSLHAINVEPFEKNDEEWVRFKLPLGDHEDQPSEGQLDHEDVILEFERPVHRTVLIKRKGAPSQRRYVVNMEFCISGKLHETQFSLTDRGRFSYPVLLGRRFMRDDNILTDSAQSFMATQECEYRTLEELAERPEALKRSD